MEGNSHFGGYRSVFLQAAELKPWHSSIPCTQRLGVVKTQRPIFWRILIQYFLPKTKETHDTKTPASWTKFTTPRRKQIFILTLLFQPKLCTTPLLRQVICSTNHQVTRPHQKKPSIANVFRFRWCVSWWPFFAVAFNPLIGVGLPCYSRVFHPCWLSS